VIDLEWLKQQPDPYTGLMVNPPGPGIKDADVQHFDMFAEPAWVYDYDDGGFTIGKRPAPRFPCQSCGQQTSRRVVCTVTVLESSTPGEMRFGASSLAICPACARAQVLQYSGHGQQGSDTARQAEAPQAGV
jgi:hypothetical protein